MTTLVSWKPTPTGTGGAATYTHEGDRMTLFLNEEADAHKIDHFINRVKRATKRHHMLAQVGQLRSIADAVLAQVPN